MFRKPFLFPRAWRLEPAYEGEDDVLALVRVQSSDAEQAVLLPRVKNLTYFIVAPRGDQLSIQTDGDFRVAGLGAPLSLKARLRLAFIRKKKKYLEFPAFSVFSTGPKYKRKRFTGFNQHMASIGLGVDGALLASRPELLAGWPAIDAPVTRPAGPAKAAIVVHIYYEDTWPDFAEVMKRLTIPFDLIVTTVPGREGLAETVRREFPWAEIAVMENRGRDVRPFLALLEEGRLDRYAYVCKMHGKKSSDGGRKAYLGSLWRRRLLFDLLAGPNIAERIIGAFERDPGIGMIGPSAFRLPSDRYSETLSWGTDNRETILEHAARMGVSPGQFRLDFFGGTMFWARPEALRPLRGLKLADAFPEETGLLDGGLEHAVERLFATSAVAAGYRLAESDGFEVLDAMTPARERAVLG